MPEILSEILQFFRASWAQNLRDPTLDAFFFGSECNADSMNSQRRSKLCAAHVGRLHAIFFCARGVPDFRKFCKFFARFLRKICVISTLDSRVILHSNARRLEKELQRSSAVRATTLAEFTQLLCARRAEIFRKLRNFFRASWAQNLRDPGAGRYLFRI